MNFEFPSAVPEIPVQSIDLARTYYVNVLGFTFDWGDEAGGIAGVSRGQCRLFLTNSGFRSAVRGTIGPVVIWLNVSSKQEVDALHAEWSRKARIVAPPEDKPWLLREFTAVDSDGNFFHIACFHRRERRLQSGAFHFV